MTVDLPAWVGSLYHDVVADDTEAMRLALQIAARNVDEGTGGPFAAVIVHEASRRVLGIGMNLVTSERCSVLHAEIVAIMQASTVVDAWNLGADGPCTLVTTAEPCAMCMGAIPWSGVSRVVIGARDEDVRSIGFDEGAKRDAWEQDLRDRGVAVLRDVLRDEAKHVLQQYVLGGGLIYNAAPTSTDTSS